VSTAKYSTRYLAGLYMSEVDLLESIDIDSLFQLTPAELDSKFNALELRLTSIRLALFDLLRDNHIHGISLGQLVLALHHSLVQLQGLYPTSLHQQVCDQYNIYWPLVWEHRSICGRTTLGHGPWERCLHIQHPHHFYCRRCTLIKVIPP
jgi:hypothetical protein